MSTKFSSPPPSQFAMPRVTNSRPPSVFSAASIDTLVADHPTSRRYRGFASEEEYLAALRDFAREQLYLEDGQQLTGWYGRKTTEDYLTQPGLKHKMKPRKVRDQRRATVAGGLLSTVPEAGGAVGGEQVKKSSAVQGKMGHGGATEDLGKKEEKKKEEEKESRLMRVFSRRKTVV